MNKKRYGRMPQRYDLKTWRDFPPMNVSLGSMLHNRTGTWRFIKPVYEDKVPACQNSCPAGNDIEGWIKLFQGGEYEKAYWHLKQEQPFPAILGRVCFKFCEKSCNRANLDEGISVRELERFLGDRIGHSTPYPPLPSYHGKALAVVGSGPAGMTAAYYGRLLGFKVTIFETLPEMGGILRIGIPAYRLPRHIVAAEFEALSNMGIVLRPGTTVGKDISFEKCREGFDYVFLATGNHVSKALGLPGEDDCPHVMNGLSLLKKIALGQRPELGHRVAIIGGGNTAIDAARTAVRLGSDVTIIYRRTESEMPAHPEEIMEAREEGVHFKFLAAPEKIETNGDGTIRRLVCCDMELGAPDSSGRRRPLKKVGDLFDLETDCVVTAVGEVASFGPLGLEIQGQRGTLPVNEALRVEGIGIGGSEVFAGGDIIDIPHTVIHAVSAGKRAAIAMDCHRRGVDFKQVFKEIAIGDGSALSFASYKGRGPVNPVRRNLRMVVGSQEIVCDYFEKMPCVKKKIQAAAERMTSFEPCAGTLDDEAARYEATRCMHCGRCTECDNCLVFCPDMSISVRKGEHFGYVFDYDYCKGCGICFTECPRQAISMVDEEAPL